MHNGYILLWRKSLDSMVWKDRKLWRLWSYILMSARWRAGRDLLGRKPVELGPGELLATLEGLAQATGLSLKEVRSALALGVRVGVIHTTPTAWGTRIAIVNWQEYQGPEAASGKKKSARQATPSGSQQPAQHQDSDKTMGTPSGSPEHMPPGKQGARARQTPRQAGGTPSPTVKKGTQQPSQAPSPHPQTGREAGAGAAAPSILPESDECQRFLDAYPKKASQQAARLRFAELRQSGELPALDILLAALARHCASPAWAAEGGRFIPTPANWLARRSWTGMTTGTGMTTRTGEPGSAIDQWLRSQENDA